MKRRAILFFSLIFASLACAEAERTLPFYDSADFTPRWELPSSGTFHAIRPFSLIDQDGAVVTERDLKGKVAVVNFFFASCPDVCPVTIRSMLELQEQFRDAGDMVLLSHTVTPRSDSVAALKEFAVDKGVDAKRWKLLTGTETELFDLGRNFYFLDDDQGEAPDDALFTHTESFVLLDKERRLRGVYNGMDPSSMEALVRDIQVLRAAR